MKNKMTLKLLTGLAIAFSMTGCALFKTKGEPSTTPHCVNPMEIASLNTGMTKGEALGKLGGLYPHDILASDETGCEIHQYYYKRPVKEVNVKRSWFRETLREGRKQYEDDQSNAYLVFKGGRLDFVLTDMSKKAEAVLMDIAQFKLNCADAANGGNGVNGGKGGGNLGSLKGCTDETALNFNKNAKIDNGTCEYCPCGYQVNKNFNNKRPVSDCNQKCVETAASKFERQAEEMRKEAERVKKLEESRRCSNCDFIDKLMNGGKGANVNLNMNLHSGVTPTSSNAPNVVDMDLGENIKTKKEAKKAKSEGVFSFFKRKSNNSDSENTDHVSLF